MKIYSSIQNYIVTLELLEDTRHNMNNSEVIDKNYAHFRCDKALVISITDKDNENILTTIDDDSYRNITRYEVGKIVTAYNYNPDTTMSFSSGIQFYLARERAFFHYKLIRNGEYKDWYYNGQMSEKGTHVNGQKDGDYKYWHYNGSIKNHFVYANGKKKGEYKYFKNGQRRAYYTYINDEYSECTLWYTSTAGGPIGHLNACYSYYNGLKNGEYKQWHNFTPITLNQFDPNQLFVNYTYLNGKKNGDYKRWFPNGQIREHYTYVKGKRIGEYKEWHYNGQIHKHCTYMKENREDEYLTHKKNGELIEYHFIEWGKTDRSMEHFYKEWHRNGQLIVHYTSDGRYRSWHANPLEIKGDKWIICSYVDGKKDGEYSEW